MGDVPGSGVYERSLTGAEEKAAKLAEKLDTPVTVAGLLALLLWLIEPTLSEFPDSALVVEGLWVGIWLGFLVEFGARLVAARSTTLFLKGHWWEVVFLAVPFLRFLRAGRAMRAARIGRAGRGVMSAVRSSRSAGSKLTQRLLWLATVTTVVALAAGRMLWDLGGYEHDYARAIHDALLGVIAGESLPTASLGADVLEIGVAIYHLLVVGALAGTAGAFLLERRPASTEVE